MAYANKFDCLRRGRPSETIPTGRLGRGVPAIALANGLGFWFGFGFGLVLVLGWFGFGLVWVWLVT